MKAKLLTVITLLLSFNLNAQLFFGTNNFISGPGLAQPRDFNATDVDGDGDLDAVIVSRGTQELVWMENKDGQGSFGEPEVLVSNVNQPSNSIGADIDGDGDQDIIFAVWGNRELMWFENLDGQGNFSEPRMIDDYANGIWRVRAADIDGDGDLDLVTAEREGDSIIWYENLDGNGSFSEKKIIFDGMVNARDAYPVDLDNDGDLDVVTSDWYTGKIAWHENLDGLGNFSDTIVISNKADDVDRLFCADFNGDGYLDILCKNRYDLYYLKNVDGGNTFTEEEVSTGNALYEQYVTDFDGDSDPDVLVSYYGAGYLGWFKNDGNGKFGELLPMPNDIGGANYLFIADINGNTYPDVVIFNYNSSLILWYDNTDGLGNTAYPRVIYIPEISTPSDMLVVDVDADGVNEILIASSYGHRLYQYKKESRSGEYGEIKSLPGFIFNPAAMDIGYITHDDFPDVVASSAYNGEIYFWSNQADGNFGTAVLVGESNSNTNDVIAVDFDKDGDDDVAAVSYNAHKLMIFENTGNGNFGPEIIVNDQLNGASCLNASDITGDGYPEILVSATIGDFIAIFENKGNLNFESPKVIDNDLNGTKNVIASDLDNDGDQDLLATAYEKVMWYENLDAAGSFGPGQSIFSWEFYGNVNDLKTADVDKDGDLDVFVISDDYNKVIWYLNENNGESFTAQYSFAEDRYGLEVLDFEDVDGDEMMDVIVASYDDNKIGWYRNEAYPVFLEQPGSFQLCQQGTADFRINVDKADKYQWQISEAYQNWFADLEEGNGFSGTKTNHLVVEAEGTALDMTSYRCVVTHLGAEFTSEAGDLNVDRLIEANAGDDDETCNSWINLYGNNTGQGTGEWTVVQGAGSIEETTEPYTIVNGLQHGTNTFKWTITSGVCVSEDEVSVVKHDSISVAIPADTFYMNKGDDIVLSVMTTGDVKTYQWYFNGSILQDDGRISGTNTADLSISNLDVGDEGEYFCFVDGECNYLYSDKMYLSVSTVGTQDLKETQFNLFPNPAAKQVSVIGAELIEEWALYTMDGSRIMGENSIDDRRININIEELPAGVYYLKIKNKTLTEVIGFVKE